MRPALASIPGSRLALVLACVLVASDARAATLHGVVHVPAPPRTAATFQPYAGQASSMVCRPKSSRGGVGDAVVYLESVPASVDSTLPAPPRPQLAQKQQEFVPRVVAVPAGGSVEFPNMDPIYHNVFSVSPVRRFDLGKYPRGESRSVRFAKAGLVNVYCDIHSDMAAFVLVLPNRALARPRADGTWQLPEVPPGRYVLCAWHPDFPTLRREVTLAESEPAPVELSFAP